MAESVILSSTDNKDPELLTTFAFDPDWSSNGNTIVFAAETQGQGYTSRLPINQEQARRKFNQYLHDGFIYI
jgi:Tol biopolymer transport system component